VTELKLLELLARIREAVGDPDGRLMQDELVERCRHCGERETIAQERNEHGEWVTPTKKAQIDLKEYARLRSIVQRIGILVATWIEQEDDWLYDSYESPETERGARDAILCAAEAVRQIFEEYKKEIES
jgi:hypothetical protein